MKINFVSKCIEVSNAEMKRAQNYGSREYEMLMQVMKELPDFQITVKQPTHAPHNPYARLTYEMMEHFIEAYYYSDSGYLCYRRNDGHGGNSEGHRREMEQIAEQIVQQRIAEVIPEIRRAATEQAYGNLLEALSFDVTSAVNIGFENGESIFRDSKTQKVVADAVMNEVRKQLKRMK